MRKSPPAPGSAPPEIAFARHDHGTCSDDVLARVEEICAERALRLTPVRRRTLEVLLEAHRAMGAYDVLERLAADGFGKQPPVAYRALDFLVEQGFVHRIRRLNAFAACLKPGTPHLPVFLICRECDSIAEADGDRVHAALMAAAKAIDFSIERANLEALGLCPRCRDRT